MSEPVTTVLDLHHIGKCYGKLSVLEDISLSLAVGECRAIVGPNGAGKTTLFNIIAGSLPPSGGEVHFQGRDITRWSEERRARSGIRRTFQRSNLFDGLTVRDNICIAVHAVHGSARVLLRRRAHFPDVEREGYRLLETVGLAHRADVVAAALSHGERRQLEIAMAISGRPRLLLLDEPTAGMTPAESRRFVEHMTALSKELTTLVIEHDMQVVFAMADVVTVMHGGRVLVEGSPAEVHGSDAARQAYYGESVPSEAART